MNETAPTRKAWHVRVAVLTIAALLFCAYLVAQVHTQHAQQVAIGNRSEALKTDGYNPALLKYRVASRWETGLTEVRGIALGPDGLVYIAGDQKIVICHADGKRRTEIILHDLPLCLAIAPDGSIYIGFREHVEVYARDGRQTARWASLGERAVITSLTLQGGDLYAADAGNRVVIRYDQAGKILARIGRHDEKRRISGLVVRSGSLDIAAAPDGKLLVANPGRHRVELYSPAGELLSSWGVASNAIDGFCGCCNPTAVALLPDGRVVTGEKSLPRVKIYHADGKFACVVAGSETLPASASGIDLAVSPKGDILLLEPTSGAVFTFTAAEK